MTALSFCDFEAINGFGAIALAFQGCRNLKSLGFYTCELAGADMALLDWLLGEANALEELDISCFPSNGFLYLPCGLALNQSLKKLTF